MKLVQTVAPTTEPITLVEAKAFLRVLGSDDDALITTMIAQATKHVENVVNRQLIRATYELYTDGFITKLPKNPIQSIEKIEYMDENEVYQLLDASLYYLYEELEIGKIEYKDLPGLLTHKKAVKITFVCGHTSVPEPIQAYIKVKVSTLYEFREQFIVGASVSHPKDDFIENLLSPYKIKEF